MKYLLALICLLMADAGIFAQSCPGTDPGKTNRGTLTEHALFISDNDRVLSFSKEIDARGKKVVPRYHVAFNSMPKQLLPDSLVNTEGDLELELTNGRKLVLPGAIATINPFASNTPLGFSLELSSEQLQAIDTPIARVTAFGQLSATFSGAEQKRMWELIRCFKSTDPLR